MKKNIILIITIAWACCSCSDFLEPDSPSEYVPKTVDALNEMLLGNAYPAADKEKSISLFAFHNMLDDDGEATTQPIVFKKTIESFTAVYSWDPEMHEKLASINAWSAYYQVIMGANAALDYLDDVKGSTEEKAWVRAQAYTLRAFYYFNLVNLFGEPYGYNKKALGVPLKLTSSLSDHFEKRNTVEEVYEQILKDLDAAEENFMILLAERRCPVSYRINLPAMQLIRARVCLHTGNNTEAAKYARKVIGDWDYELYDLRTYDSTSVAPYPDYVTLTNPEVIWTYGNVDDVNQLWYSIYGYLGNSSAPSDKRYAYVASRDLVESYADSDLRKYRYLVSEYVNKEQNTFIPCSKMKFAANHNPKSSTEYAFSLRLSEAYLILAEAIYDTDAEGARKLINDLREMRYKAGKCTPIEDSGADLLNFIREERRRELCFEGQRWFDLRRYGMPTFRRQWTEKGEVLGYFVMEKEDPAYTLPIPSIVMERNPALVQNRLGNPKVLTQK